MYLLPLWARVFILVLFCVDYNLAGYSIQEIYSLIEQIDRWPDRQEYICSSVGLKESSSRRTSKISLNIVEKLKLEGRYHNPIGTHYRFDIMKSGRKSSFFYDFQIEAFTYYFEKDLRFSIQDGGTSKTLSFDFASERDLRYFYERAAKFGKVSRGVPFNDTIGTNPQSVTTYNRNTNEQRTVCYRVDLTVDFLEDNDVPIYNIATYSTDTGTDADVPVLIFSSKQFNVGAQTMDRRVMLYLTDYPNIIIVVNFPSSREATKFYDSIKRHRSRSNNDMLSLDEMQKYVP